MNIFQIYYLESQAAKLDPEFIPVYNAPNPQERWFEYGVMRGLWQNHRAYFDDYVGVFSHKFYEKSGLTGKEVKAHIAKHAGADVYLFNPITILAASYMSASQWQQGEGYHRGLIRTMTNLLKALKMPVKLEELIDYSDSVVYCNYWVGSPRFWQAYMAFTDEFYRLIEADKDNTLGARSLVAHAKDAHPMVPFIMERLPTLFLSLNPQFKYVAYEYPDELIRARFGKAYDDLMALKHAKDTQDAKLGQHYLSQMHAKLSKAQLNSLYRDSTCPDE